jgi:ketosteroid isomerase-like protein
MSWDTADAAQAAFYAAFAACDLEAMRSLWMKDEALCMHPGAVPLVSYEAVMRSWEHIFADAVMPSLHFQVIRRIEGGDLAVHVVEEQIGAPDGSGSAAIVLATNVYRRTDKGWLMASHQGVLMSAGQAQENPTLQ